MKKNIFFLFVVVFFAATIYLPGLIYRIPRSFFLTNVFVVSFLWFRARRFLFSKITFFYFLFSVYILLAVGLKSGGMYGYVLSHLFGFCLIPFFSFLLLLALLAAQDFKLFRLCVGGMVMLVLLSCVQTLRADADISRNLISNAQSLADVSELIENAKNGVSGYGLAHALPFLVPALFVCGKNQKRLLGKCFYLSTMVILIFSVFHTGYGTSSGVVVALLGASIFLSKRKYCFWGSVCAFGGIVFLLVATNVMGEILLACQTLFDPESMIYHKIQQIELQLNTTEGGGEWMIRVEKYRVAWNAFLAHPLFGGSINETEGHSFLLTWLGIYGIVGISAVSFMFFYVWCKIKNILDAQGETAYLLITLFLFVIWVIKSEALREQLCFLFLVIPALLLNQQYFYYAASYKVRRMFRLRCAPMYGCPERGRA